ncbi:MAG: aminotransferase class V-fold PLP-dependent enzyme [Candidatus Tyrphobacter sp.]
MTAIVTQALRRDAFPILRDCVYLVSHSMGAAPLGARAALERYWQDWSRDGPQAWERWLPEIETIADGIGSLVGAPPGSVALAPNVSLLIASVLSSLDFRGERSEIVYEELQFPSLAYVIHEWERIGARTHVVASDDGRTVPTERIVEAITERTAIAVLSHAYYRSGAVADVKTIARRCRDVGAVLCVDAYQTTGVYPYDVVELGLDVAVGGSHKWLCGGPGCAWIYVRPELRERFHPAVTGWMGHARPFDFAPPPIEHARSMYRFATGTPTIPGYVAARPGHALIAQVGVGAIREHNVALTTLLANGAIERGLRVPTPLEPEQRTGWIGMNFENARGVCERLVARRIFVDYRPECGIRVSPHFYTSEEEIERFFSALDEERS